MRKRCFLLALLLMAALLTGCMRADGSASGDAQGEKPQLPEDLRTDADGVPILKVYDVENEAVSQMDIETYVMGVLAGEMKNDWPEEALKAQAILARTFVLKFIETKDSKYEGADISTDVSEAQAYSEADINDRVRAAVEETRGQVMSYEGELVQAWFHAHAGGKTELPSVSLEYKEADPPYLAATDSPDSDKAPEDVQHWTATFDAAAFQKACADAGLATGLPETVQIGETGDSGRAKTLLVNGSAVSAPSLRLQLGANAMKSTLLDSVSVEDGKVIMKGRGFGHGVGMSQWGAYGMAEEGATAEEIIRHYFQNIDIVRLWE
ncbi:MAG TPA: SpoIID/LytB domain-containing protein [Candidatus Pullichristensenella excrementipullorum]|nr:SpoIID/LytB domain-containing protein [Candidatus Pullichristensenella excrementipullorum]